MIIRNGVSKYRPGDDDFLDERIFLKTCFPRNEMPSRSMIMYGIDKKIETPMIEYKFDGISRVW